MKSCTMASGLKVAWSQGCGHLSTSLFWLCLEIVSYVDSFSIHDQQYLECVCVCVCVYVCGVCVCVGVCVILQVFTKGLH